MLKFFENFGKKCRKNKKYSLENDYVVYNDTIIEIIFPKQYVETIKQFYRKTKSFDEKGLAPLYKLVFGAGAESKVRIIKDAEKASQIRKTVMKMF